MVLSWEYHTESFNYALFIIWRKGRKSRTNEVNCFVFPKIANNLKYKHEFQPCPPPHIRAKWLLRRQIMTCWLRKFVSSMRNLVLWLNDVYHTDSEVSNYGGLLFPGWYIERTSLFEFSVFIVKLYSQMSKRNNRTNTFIVSYDKIMTTFHSVKHNCWPSFLKSK